MVIFISLKIFHSVRLKRLFPPVQWWMISFLPGVALALAGVLVFVSPQMESNYTILHSLWHALIALSVLGILPWPDRWRRALKPVVPLSTSLSCGASHSTPGYGSIFLNKSRVFSEHIGGNYVSFMRWFVFNKITGPIWYNNWPSLNPF